MEQQCVRVVRVCGSGSNGLLLTGSTDDVTELREADVSKLRLKTINVGGMFAIATNTEGQVLVWGMFDRQLLAVPKTIGVIPIIDSVNCGWDHSIMVDSGGGMYGLGCNKFNQLTSSKTRLYYSEPAKLLQGVKLVACGFRQTFYSTGDQRIYGRGQNRYGELTVQPQLDADGWAKIVHHHQPIRKMGCGKSFFVFLDSQNKLYGCGSNQPTVFTGLSERIEKITLGYNDIADFAAGWKHLAVCLLDNTLKCYGSNTLGQLGHDQTTDCVNLPTTEPITSVELVAGTQFTFCSTAQGVYCWGWNEHNNLSSSKQQVIDRPILLSNRQAKVLTHGAVTFLLEQ